MVPGIPNVGRNVLQFGAVERRQRDRRARPAMADDITALINDLQVLAYASPLAYQTLIELAHEMRVQADRQGVPRPNGSLLPS